MAKEAVLKVKEAEDLAAELVKDAQEKARTVIAAAERESIEKYRALLKLADAEKDAIVREAVRAAEAECGPLDQEGGAQANQILNPDHSKYEKAVTTVMERIVNQFGNS